MRVSAMFSLLPANRWQKNTFMLWIVPCALVLVLNSCTHEQSQSSAGQLVADSSSSFSPQIKHAKYFTIQQQGAWKQVVVIDPWKGDTLGFYALVPRSAALPGSLPTGATVLRVPVSTMACLSCTHVGSLALLDRRDCIVGVSNGDQICDSIIHKRFGEGKIIEVGRQMNTNFEQLIALSPDLVMKSGYDNVRNEDARIVEAHIPIGYNIEWMEPDLLARAEWMKFVAAFVGRDREADSIFNEIEIRYNEAIALAQSVSARPSVLFGLDYKGAWHISGSQSYVAKMLHDAGADFVANGDKGASPLNFEQVLEIHANDDKWLNWMHQGVSSREALGRMNERYSLFKAFRTGEVYNHDKRLNAAGGNDFWESGVSRPDLLLKDLVKIFHPDLLPDYEMVYWRKLPDK